MITGFLERLSRWGLFLGCSAVILLSADYYLTHPGTLLRFDADGLRRLGALAVGVLGFLAQGRAIIKYDSPWRVRGNEPSVAPAGSGDSVHPFRLASRNRPALIVVFLMFLFALPVLLALASSDERTFWPRVLIGELIAVLVLLGVWYRARR